jgi:hypothetical protein
LKTNAGVFDAETLQGSKGVLQKVDLHVSDAGPNVLRQLHEGKSFLLREHIESIAEGCRVCLKVVLQELSSTGA